MASPPPYYSRTFQGNNLTWTVNEGYPQFTPGRESSSFVTQLRCNWSDRLLLACALYSTGPVLSIAGMNLVLNSISIVPDKGQCFLDPNDSYGMSANYLHAMLTITWNTHRNSSGGQIYEESFEPCAEMLMQHEASFRWASDLTMPSPEQVPALLLRSADYKLTLYQVASIPSWVQSLVGCVNNNEVVSYSMGLSFDPETLYYNPPEITHGSSIGQADSWTIATRWSWKQQGWNKVWNPKANGGEGGWDSFVVMANNGNGSSTPVNYKPYTPTPFPSPIGVF